MASTSNQFADRFAPYDDRTQPAMRVDGYKETLVRVPKQAFYKGQGDLENAGSFACR